MRRRWPRCSSRPKRLSRRSPRRRPPRCRPAPGWTTRQEPRGARPIPRAGRLQFARQPWCRARHEKGGQHGRTHARKPSRSSAGANGRPCGRVVCGELRPHSLDHHFALTEATMTQRHQQSAQVIALDDYRRACRRDDEPRPPSSPQAAYPPPPPKCVTVVAASDHVGRLAYVAER